MREEEAILIITAMVIFTGAGLLWAAMVNRRRVREMEHRERLAMIERGMAPPTPSWSERPPGPTSASSSRFRTAGIVLVGVGLGLFFLIGFAAGAPGVGIGVGGGWAVLGAALLFNHYLLESRGAGAPGHRDSGPGSRPPVSPAGPPDNVAP